MSRGMRCAQSDREPGELEHAAALFLFLIFYLLLIVLLVIFEKPPVHPGQGIVLAIDVVVAALGA